MIGFHSASVDENVKFIASHIVTVVAHVNVGFVGAVFITGAAFTVYVCVIVLVFPDESVAVYTISYVHTVLKSTVHVCVTVKSQSTSSFAVTVSSVNGVHTVVVNV